MKKLTIDPKTFTDMLSDLIASGVTFEAKENKQGDIEVTE